MDAKGLSKLDIIFDVCDKYLSDNWAGPGKKNQTPFERAIYYTIARELTIKSYRHIGIRTGRDYATVLYGLKIFDKDIAGKSVQKKDEKWYNLYLLIKSKCLDAIQKRDRSEEILLEQNISLKEENERLRNVIKEMV